MSHIVALKFIDEILLLEREIFGKISTLSFRATIISAHLGRLLGSNMYAVIKSGGKQYKVAAGEKLKIEQIPSQIGEKISLDQVLMVSQGDQVTVGSPLVNGAVVSATVLGHGRADKVKIFKMRRRKHYQKRQGHRQNFTEVMIDEIKG
jgi:large subunit ribosomal protein L21